MKKIIIIRAGRSAWEDDDRIQGTLPLPICESGKETLRQIASLLKEEGIRCLYSSGNESSGPTAKYLSEICGLKTKKNPSLCELNCGLWQGLRIEEVKKRFGSAYKQWIMDPTSFTPPQGESMLAAYERVQEAVLHIIKKSRSKTVAIVSAQVVSAMIECFLTGRQPQHVWDIVKENAPLKIIEIQEPFEFKSSTVHVPSLLLSSTMPMEFPLKKNQAVDPLRCKADIA
jgi:broad specificity phosphatase PhoE